jgi:hypothetical protein
MPARLQLSSQTPPKSPIISKITNIVSRDNREIEDDDDVLNQATDNVGERGFDDLTDLKNEDFIYVY